MGVEHIHQGGRDLRAERPIQSRRRIRGGARSFENAADKTKGSGLQVQERPSSSCPSPLSKAFVQSPPHLSCLLQSRGEKNEKREGQKFLTFICLFSAFGIISLQPLGVPPHPPPPPSPLPRRQLMLVASHSLSLHRLFVCIEALAAVLLSPLQFGFSQFVVCYGHSLVSTHTHGGVRTHTHAQSILQQV